MTPRAPPFDINEKFAAKRAAKTPTQTPTLAPTPKEAQHAGVAHLGRKLRDALLQQRLHARLGAARLHARLLPERCLSPSHF